MGNQRTPHVKGCVCDLSQTPDTHVHRHAKGCVFDLSQTQGTHVHPHAKGCLVDYHKHEALRYTPMLRDVYLIIANTRH